MRINVAPVRHTIIINGLAVMTANTKLMAIVVLPISINNLAMSLRLRDWNARSILSVNFLTQSHPSAASEKRRISTFDSLSSSSMDLTAPIQPIYRGGISFREHNSSLFIL
jgi:hypothetical protein